MHSIARIRLVYQSASRYFHFEIVLSLTSIEPEGVYYSLKAFNGEMKTKNIFLYIICIIYIYKGKPHVSGASE